MRKLAFMQKLRHRSAVVPSLYFLNFKPVAIFCGWTAQFVLDLIRNPKDRFFHDVAHILCTGVAGACPCEV